MRQKRCGVAAIFVVLLAAVALLTSADASAKKILEITSGGGPVPSGTKISDFGTEFWLEQGFQGCREGGKLGLEGQVTVNDAATDLLTISGQAYGWCFGVQENTVTLTGLPWKVDLKKKGLVTIKGTGRLGVESTAFPCVYRARKLTGHWTGGNTFTGGVLTLVASESSGDECQATTSFTLWFFPRTEGRWIYIEEVDS
jgi:hypothetical protein